MTLRVQVGRVNEVATEFQISIQDSSGVFWRRSPAPILTERHGTKAQRAHSKSGVTQSHEVVEGHRVSWRIIAPICLHEDRIVVAREYKRKFPEALEMAPCSSRYDFVRNGSADPALTTQAQSSDAEPAPRPTRRR